MHLQEGKRHVRPVAERARLSSYAPQASRAGEESLDHGPTPTARALLLLRASAAYTQDQVPDGNEGEDAIEAGTRSHHG